MAKGQSYHPRFIQDVLNDSIPAELAYLLKPWQITKWRKNKPVFIGENFYNLNQKKSFKMEYLKMLAIIRMYKLRFQLSNPHKKLLVTKNNEKLILRQVYKSNRYLTLRLCCEYLGLSSRKYLALKKEKQIRECTPEVYFKCNKFKKHQLTTTEVFKIKSILEDPTHKSWPISRLHCFCIKNNLATASYNSWLMVKNLFEIDRNSFKPFKSKNKKGLRALQPNEYLHTDVSRFVLQLNKKAYLFLMMDNYSKFIINAVIAEKSNHEINTVHLIESMKTVRQNKLTPIELWSDKGTENTAKDFAKKIKEFGITHIIAQHDNPLSNSMVERMFASIKKFIRNKYKNIEISIQQLINGLNEFVQIHNFEMPIYKLFKTPYELYWNIDASFNYSKEITTAIENRLMNNSKLKCAC